MHVFCPDCNAEYKVNERSSLTKTVKFVCVECGKTWVDRFEKLEKAKATGASLEPIGDDVIKSKKRELGTVELNSLALEEVQNSFGNHKNTSESKDNKTESDYNFQFETSAVTSELGNEGPSKSFPNIKDKLENHGDNQIEERDAKEIAIEKRLKESSELLKKAKQPHIDNKQTTQKKKNRPKSRTVLVTLAILLVASFFTYNLFILFLDEILRDFPFVQDILSQTNFYGTLVIDTFVAILESIMNFIPKLV